MNGTVSQTYTCAINTTYMDSAQGDAIKESKEVDPAHTIKQDVEHDLSILGKIPENEKGTSSSSSNSSSDSSDEDFFQLDPTELNRALAGNTKLASVFTIPSPETTVAATLFENEGLFARPQVPIGSPFSPSVQVMARNDVPDPNRIPASIFTPSKSSTPMEWSVASNESLFSIHVGNSSFSRDHSFLLNKSGELGFTPPISPLPSPSPVRLGMGLTQPGAAAAANAEAMKDVLRAAAEGHAVKSEPPAAVPLLSRSTSRRSDGSGTSFRSFAFPIHYYFSLTEGRSRSVKVEPAMQRLQPEQQPLPQLPPPETLKAPPSAETESRWFSCLSCCSCCR